MATTNPLESVEFATNPDPRCACVLVLDTSASMDGAPIDALNVGLEAFQADINDDPLAQRRVEVAIVTCGGGVDVAQAFVTANQFAAPRLQAAGHTPLGEAVVKAVSLIRDRKGQYKASGVPYYRPWIVVITDGQPTDDWQAAAQLVHDEEAQNGLAFFAVGVGGADMHVLGQMGVREPVKLDGLRFAELFVWLSQSQRRVSAAKPGEQTALPPVGWAAV